MSQAAAMAQSAIATTSVGTSTKRLAPPLFRPASLTPNPSPIPPPISDLPISTAQVSKALTALIAHVAKTQEKRAESDLLGDTDEKVFLVVGLKRAAKREVHMPIRLQLAHPVMDPRTSPVTLFVKDPQRTYKDLLESSKISFISRVVGLSKLRTKHKTFEAKRALLKEGELFLVDDRVVLDVGKCTGKMWREAKKQPIPIALSRKDLKGELERAVASTYLQINTGTSLSIKFGTTELHSQAQLLENVLSLIPQLAVRLPNEGWSNVASLHIKTSTSASLPIYNASLDESGIFAPPSSTEVAAKQAAIAAKDAKEVKRQQAEIQREKLRKERSATKEGKGREEKKRKAEAEVEEVDLDITKPLDQQVEVEKVEVVEEKRPKKKSKTEEVPALVEVKTKKVNKVKA